MLSPYLTVLQMAQAGERSPCRLKALRCNAFRRNGDRLLSIYRGSRVGDNNTRAEAVWVP